MRKAIKVGLTGTTGAGKSTVAEGLKKYGYAVIDADRIARIATEKNSPLLPKLAEAFGNDIINEDGSLNRKLLAERAFKGDFERNTLNSITHPEIIRLMNKKIHGAFWDGYEAVIIDAPQLFESGMDKSCNLIISVVAPEEVRLKRIMERDELTEELARRRMRAQLPDDFFRQNSDYVIENTGDEEALKEKILYVARMIEVKISGEGTLDF
ncbi:MAG: dephospho-CoA kinase [Clostridia bacterium]|nr:dephospho-CoA kinase [Clostridia bacterium]MBR5015352.1 dephospho-CoA kinase [Clostridia bacterium]MBR5976454.1 dephospho-CoA kinase [Clostridia bacterium]MBR6479514.1 dephospho-CoA kinase [Clostridia bacterium]MBR6512667.1 dephospho-CoA kinase [Clostridia bacterium]